MSFADDLTSRLGAQSCLSCEKPTASHALLIRFDEDAEEYVAADVRENADTVRALCHACYREFDGDPDRAAAAYNEYVEEIAANAGRTVREFHEQTTGEADE